MSWPTTRPIYKRLPECGYDDNPIADWLTRFPDDVLVQTKNRVDDLERQVNPMTCDREWLNYLAALSGFVNEYWDRSWPDAIKRQIIAAGFTEIWPYLGTKRCMDFFLNLFSITHEWRFLGGFYLNLTPLGSILGTTGGKYYLILPFSYARTGHEFRLTEKFMRLFAPATAKGRACYPRFILGVSRLGDIL